MDNHSELADRLFSHMRQSPWDTNPMGVPQEGSSGNGNIESQGWLSDNSVTADVLQANSVIAGKIDADAISAREIQADAVTASEIAANTITSNEIAANTITANELAANSVTANELAANSVVAGDITANAVTAGTIAANAVTANEIAANTITASEIAADAITTNELAANAVITENVLAANITSSKIELTVSAKNLRANAGSAALPSISFDASPTTGMHYGAGEVHVANSTYTRWGVANIHTGGDFLPDGSMVYDLGSSAERWHTLYAFATDITSDERLKRDIADVPLGLDFVKSLRPREYRWRETLDEQARQKAAASIDRDALERASRPHEARIERIRQRQLEGKLSDADAEDQVDQVRGKLGEIRERHLRPVVEARGKRRPGRRKHMGLIAQEVKESLDKAGVDSVDAGFWKQAPDGMQSLDYIELIPVLIRGMQEQDATIAEQGTTIGKLTARVEALERSSS